MEIAAAANHLGIFPVHFVHPKKGKVLLPVLRRTHQPPDDIAVLQVETPDLGGGNVDVIAGGEAGFVPEEAEEGVVVGGHDLQDPFGIKLLAGGKGLHHRKLEFI